MTTPHTISITVADLGWLLNRTEGNVRTDSGSRFAWLDTVYREALKQVNTQTSLAEDIAEAEAQAKRANELIERIKAAQALPPESSQRAWGEPTHYAVVVEASRAEPLTVTTNKATALEVARIFNLSQEMHPEGRALTAEVYGYVDGGKGGIITR